MNCWTTIAHLLALQRAQMLSLLKGRPKSANLLWGLASFAKQSRRLGTPVTLVCQGAKENPAIAKTKKFVLRVRVGTVFAEDESV